MSKSKSKKINSCQCFEPIAIDFEPIQMHIEPIDLQLEPIDFTLEPIEFDPIDLEPLEPLTDYENLIQLSAIDLQLEPLTEFEQGLVQLSACEICPLRGDFLARPKSRARA